MTSRSRWTVGAGALLLTAALGAAPAAAQKAVSIGSNPPGTVFYATGSGLAKVVSDSGGVKMAVQPYAGSSTFLPLLDSGELEFGVVNAVDMALTYRGPGFKIGGRNPFPHAPNIRLLMRGSPLLVALLVRKDSPIKNVHDVRGKRMTGEYPAHLAVWYKFYFGMLSMITPPVCLATYAAASIGGADFMKTGWTGMRLGIVAYVVPFVFAYHPALLGKGSAGDIALAVGAAALGVILLGIGCAGHLFRPLGRAGRALACLAGLCLIPAPTSGVWVGANLVGLGLGLGLIAWERNATRLDRVALAEPHRGGR